MAHDTLPARVEAVREALSNVEHVYPRLAILSSLQPDSWAVREAAELYASATVTLLGEVVALLSLRGARVLGVLEGEQVTLRSGDLRLRICLADELSPSELVQAISTFAQGIVPDQLADKCCGVA